MRPPHPPRLAVVLFRRFVPDNEPLLGDLLELFATGRSRRWFWRQVLLAIATDAVQPRPAEHPLGLSDSRAAFSEPARTVDLPGRINLTASPLPDAGGLGLVVLGTLVSVVRPDAWWIFAPAVAGGVLLGAALAMIRRHGALSGSDGNSLTPPV